MGKILHLAGARPQFIKLAPLLRKGEILVHSGQHYDYSMSQVFFDTLGIKKPDYHLDVGSGSHGEQTGRILIEFEKVCLKERPSLIIVYGDCNTTLAGALVGAKLHIPVCHVEAGVRSYDKGMPEEINRVLTDHCSSILFAPSATAVTHLKNEGITKGVHNVGDVMYEMFLKSGNKSGIIRELELKKGYCLVTLHRPSNVDDKGKLQAIFSNLSRLNNEIVFPIHPRTAKSVKEFKINTGRVRIEKPVGYFDMIELEKHAGLIVTDSGGVQKEAYYSKVPCIVLRTTTEWPEILGRGAVLLGENYDALPGAAERLLSEHCTFEGQLFGDGSTSERIFGILGGK
jgi:UDP-N-acetylglucosamine 2-epimerase